MEKIGKKIKELRLQQSMKLKELSQKTGLTASFISQVERGITVPSISSLKKVSDALGISISSFFNEIDKIGEGNKVSPVVREDQRRILKPVPGVTYQLLTKDLSGKIEFILATYDPGADSGPARYTHNGEECTLVLEGTMHLEIGDSVYHLGKGDSVLFSCEIPHRVRNTGKVKAVSIWCITPPSF